MEKDTGRTEAFSDGIVSVAITLLGVEIGIGLKEMHGQVSNQSLIHELLAIWPKYVGYFNSFATVLLMWMMHHRLFKMLRTTNVVMQLSNGFLLLVIALVPFPTKTVGEFIFTPTLKAAVIFYVGYFTLVGVTFLNLTFQIRNHPELRVQSITRETVNKVINMQLIGFGCNIGLTLCAFFSPQIALFFSFAMWIFWASITKATEEEKTF